MACQSWSYFGGEIDLLPQLGEKTWLNIGNIGEKIYMVTTQVAGSDVGGGPTIVVAISMVPITCSSEDEGIVKGDIQD